MRKVIVYHLVIIYALAVIRPILPVINDALAHLFFEHHHLETVHHSHGHQHVQSEMKIISLDIQNFNDSDKIKVLDTLDIHFNADENSGPYQALLNLDPPNPLDLELKLVDAFRQVHPQRSAPEGTFSNFQNQQTDGARIDWIVVSADWKIESAAIDRTAHEGRTPSDHFPVLATIQMGKEAAKK